MKNTFAKALKETVPVFCSYIFIGIAYGLLMAEAGYSWKWALLFSMLVYTGAYQFALIPFLTAGTSVITIGLTALFMNSRQIFYTLTFLEDLTEMKNPFKKWYITAAMTDESYAVDCSLLKEEETAEEKKERHETMLYVAVLCHVYWMLGSVLGELLHAGLPFDLTGIDFSMTALFITIFIDQWEKAEDHRPALAGLLSALILLFLLGKSRFILPALLASSGILLFLNAKKEGESK